MKPQEFQKLFYKFDFAKMFPGDVERSEVIAKFTDEVEELCLDYERAVPSSQVYREVTVEPYANGKFLVTARLCFEPDRYNDMVEKFKLALLQESGFYYRAEDNSYVVAGIL